jgi:hypothetical protein
MRKTRNGTGLLVVMELGAEWPGLPEADASARRVIAQLEGESPAQFAERVAQGLDGLFGRGIKLGRVALACNERVDVAADGARRKLAGLSLGIMAKHQSGRVNLTAPARSSGRLRHSLAALAQGLFEEWRTAGLEASVVFGDLAEEAGSGPRASVTASLTAPSARVA